MVIVGFWAIMTGWLIRINWNDGNAPFSDMSPKLVFRQVLKHEVASNLGIYRGKQRIGSVTVTPLHSPANAVSLDGNISIPQQAGKPENYSFSLRFDLDESTLQPDVITLRLSRRQPALNVHLGVLLKEKKVRYTIKNGDLDLGTQELPLSSDGFSMLAPALAGFPSLPIEPTTLLNTLEYRANRANFAIRGERMDGFRVKFNAAGVSATATLGQLGEIFLLRTSSEYQLLAEGLEPRQYLP